MPHSPFFGLVIQWIIEPLIITGLYLMYRGWKARARDENADA